MKVMLCMIATAMVIPAFALADDAASLKAGVQAPIRRRYRDVESGTKQVQAHCRRFRQA